MPAPPREGPSRSPRPRSTPSPSASWCGTSSVFLSPLDRTFLPDDPHITHLPSERTAPGRDRLGDLLRIRGRAPDDPRLSETQPRSPEHVEAGNRRDHPGRMRDRAAVREPGDPDGIEARPHARAPDDG